MGFGAPPALFWVVYSDAMIFLAPLVATIVFGKSSDLSGATLSFYKAALGSALFGVPRQGLEAACAKFHVWCLDGGAPCLHCC